MFMVMEANSIPRECQHDTKAMRKSGTFVGGTRFSDSNEHSRLSEVAVCGATSDA